MVNYSKTERHKEDQYGRVLYKCRRCGEMFLWEDVNSSGYVYECKPCAKARNESVIRKKVAVDKCKVRMQQRVQKALAKIRKVKYMRIFSVEARDMMPEDTLKFMTVRTGKKADVNIPPIVSFQLQSGNVSEVGVNGLQISDILLYCKNLLSVLNETFPSKNNVDSIDHIEEALESQNNLIK